MATQLALADDLAPRRKALHLVSKGPRTEKAYVHGPMLPFGPREASVFTLPWPEPAPDVERVRIEHTAHACGIGKHWVACVNKRCALPTKTPCFACEQAVAASYRAGRYVSR